jgi:hypothetical protein
MAKSSRRVGASKRSGSALKAITTPIAYNFKTVQKSPYWILVLAALLGNLIAVAMTFMYHLAYQMEADEALAPQLGALVASIVLGIFVFVWAVIVLYLSSKKLLGKWSRSLIALTGIVSLVAAIAAGWFPPSAQVVEKNAAIGAYKGAIVTLYVYQAIVYFALAALPESA